MSPLEALKATQQRFFEHRTLYPHSIAYLCNIAFWVDSSGAARKIIQHLLKQDGISLCGEGFGTVRRIPNERRRLWLAKKIEELS